MLGQLPILVVEDEPFLALDLADAIQRMDGLTVGPVDTVSAALALLRVEPVKAAILDANLADRDVTPLALNLIARGVPFIIYTGTGLPTDLATDYPDLLVIKKPAQSTLVLAALMQQISPDRGLLPRMEG